MKTKCCECGKMFRLSEEGGSVSCDEYACDKCIEANYFTCQNCKDMFHNDEKCWGVDDEEYCNDCYSDLFDCCDDCEDFFWKDDLHFVVGDKYVCSSCLESNYFFCSHCEEYYPLEEQSANSRSLCINCYEDTEQDGDAYRFYYHEKRRLWTIPPHKVRLAFGVEVEKEDFDELREWNAGDLYDNSKWIIEEDGSLDSYSGYELISGILPLDFKHRKFVTKPLEAVKSLINAKSSSNCGGHIHVSDKFRKPIELARDIRGYMPLFYAMYPTRANNGYCGKCSFKDIFRVPHQHNRAFNCGDETLEIRIFPSPKNIEQLKWRIELLHLMLVNPRIYTDDVIKDIVHKNALYLHLKDIYSDYSLNNKIKDMCGYPEFFKNLSKVNTLLIK